MIYFCWFLLWSFQHGIHMNWGLIDPSHKPKNTEKKCRFELIRIQFGIAEQDKVSYTRRRCSLKNQNDMFMVVISIFENFLHLQIQGSFSEVAFTIASCACKTNTYSNRDMIFGLVNVISIDKDWKKNPSISVHKSTTFPSHDLGSRNFLMTYIIKTDYSIWYNHSQVKSTVSVNLRTQSSTYSFLRRPARRYALVKHFTICFCQIVHIKIQAEKLQQRCERMGFLGQMPNEKMPFTTKQQNRRFSHSLSHSLLPPSFLYTTLPFAQPHLSHLSPPPALCHPLQELSLDLLNERFAIQYGVVKWEFHDWEVFKR